MSEVTTIGLGLAKHVFQAHGADASGKVVFRKRLRRERVLEFFAGKPACVAAMEACSSAHHWARELARLSHVVRLIPPAYVKPFVKRQKNEAADASAPAQANAVVFRARDLLSDNGHRPSTLFAGVLASMVWSRLRAQVT